MRGAGDLYAAILCAHRALVLAFVRGLLTARQAKAVSCPLREDFGANCFLALDALGERVKRRKNNPDGDPTSLPTPAKRCSPTQPLTILSGRFGVRQARRTRNSSCVT